MLQSHSKAEGKAVSWREWTLWLLLVGPVCYLASALLLTINNRALVAFWRMESWVGFFIVVGIMHLLAYFFPRASTYLWCGIILAHFGFAVWSWVIPQQASALASLVRLILVIYPPFDASWIGGAWLAQKLSLPIYRWRKA